MFAENDSEQLVGQLHKTEDEPPAGGRTSEADESEATVMSDGRLRGTGDRHKAKAR